MPTFGVSLKIDLLGEVQIAESPEQINAQSRVGLSTAEPISFPHSFRVESGNEVLVFKNESTGKTVGLKIQDAGEWVEITSLLWRELEKDGLGEGARFSWSCGSFTNNRVKAATAWRVFEPDTALVASVDLPVFRYKDDGVIQSTGTTNRTLVSVSKNFPIHCTTIPGVDAGDVDAPELTSSYTYELPDGRLSSIVNDGQGALPTQSLPVSIRGTLPFHIIYDDDPGEGFNDADNGAQRRAAMEYAVNIWADRLIGTVPVVVHASLVPMEPGFLGGSLPLAYGISDPSDTEFDHVDTVYVSSLANQLFGSDFWPSDGDIRIRFSTAFIDEFYFGTDGNCPNHQYDFATIVLHELAHGLGFADGMDSDGSYLIPNTPLVFDHSLYYDGDEVVSLSQTDRETAITSRDLFWNGSYAMSANGGARIEMYAPSTYNGRSSVSHWDDSVSFATFMKHAYVSPLHTIDSRLLGALQDMEWILGFSYRGWVLEENIPVGQQGELDDPAGDGIENIWKFAVGLNAMTGYEKSDLYTYAIDPVEEEFSITYATAKFRPQVTIISERTDRLNYPGWDTKGITTEKIGDTAEQEIWTSTIPVSDKGFIQLRVDLE